MNLAPLVDSGWVVISHTVAALLGVLLGALQFYLPKGTTLHRWLGRTWVGMLVIVSLSSFFINDIRVIGPFSPIHILSVLVLYSLFSSVRAIRRGNVKKHKKEMLAVYAYGLGLAGLFTFWPGRVMHQLVFGS